MVSVISKGNSNQAPGYNEVECIDSVSSYAIASTVIPVGLWFPDTIRSFKPGRWENFRVYLFTNSVNSEAGIYSTETELTIKVLYY